MDHVCEKPSTDNFVSHSRSGVGRYDAALTVEEQRYSTVRNPFWANSHIYYCQYCTTNLHKLYINKKINVLFCICPPCALQKNVNMERIFGSIPITVISEYN